MAATRRDAARDGAKRGMSMTLDKLQQSPEFCTLLLLLLLLLPLLLVVGTICNGNRGCCHLSTTRIRCTNVAFFTDIISMYTAYWNLACHNLTYL